MKGVFTALVSPFGANGSLDLAAYRRSERPGRCRHRRSHSMWHYWRETPSLTLSEKQSLIRTDSRRLKGSGVKVFAGTGGKQHQQKPWSFQGGPQTGCRRHSCRHPLLQQALSSGIHRTLSGRRRCRHLRAHALQCSRPDRCEPHGGDRMRACGTSAHSFHQRGYRNLVHERDPGWLDRHGVNRPPLR